jgi:hypothetical protein
MDETNLSRFMSRRFFVAAAGVSVASADMAAEKSAEMPPDTSNFGRCPDDRSLREAWKQFCRNLEAAGERAFKGYNPATPLLRADAFRFLTQNLGQAFAMGYETKDTRFPVIYTFCTPFCKLGGDNADCVYQQAWIDGESVYKISGTKGTVRFLNFTVMGPRPEMQPGTNWRSLQDPFGDIPEANLFGHDLQTDWDGSFELYIGGPKRGPNWLPSTPNTRRLFIRQYFDNWTEVSARLRIERVGMTEPRPVPTPADMERAMSWAGRFVTSLMTDWPDWGYAYSSAMDPFHVNEFPADRRALPDPAYNAAADKRRGRTIINMTWKLAPDEALIIEFDNHDVFWMMTNMGVFLNSMDYLYRPVSYTPSRTKVDSDGKIRMILCHEDPGYYNWIDTQGFDMGNITSRNVLSEAFTEYRTRLVKRSELAAALPADIAKVSKEQRAQLMLERFHAIQQRYSL